MNQRTSRSLLVIGSGPGIGTHVASEFATKRFNNVALLARDAHRLAEAQAAIEAVVDGTVTVRTFRVDITDSHALHLTLEEIGQMFGQPECVYFNAATIVPTKFFEIGEHDIKYDFDTTCTALYHTARWAMPQLVALATSDPQARPSFLVTSSLLPEQPIADLFSLSMVKAAQKNILQSLSSVYGPQGIHIGLVTVGGPVHPAAESLNPRNIAANAWDLFEGDQNRFEIRIM